MIINGKTLLEMAPIRDMEVSKLREHGVSYGLTECGYDIRLKQTVRFTEDGGAYVDDLYIPDTRFVLASSIEEFNMPTKLMGKVMNKSTWARRGIDASATTNIEPGWRGYLTIELDYKRKSELTIPAGSGICQIIFYEILHPAEYVGKYQDQENQPVKAR